ncbi:sporulation protein [Risungbinella massiliensis]|uniref:sporulation protein n=1 Tax=Risungbinella massiliensis TaxID=1329796 RepID=UPI0005CC68FD|nr:sporulation protein [Risungbinella massiliensis]
MLKKFLASIGVGNAKIDLMLDQSQLTMGETITGHIHVIGGDVEQKVDGLSVGFRVASRYSNGDQTVHVDEKVADIPITRDQFVLQPREQREYPFHFTCPHGIPVSSVTTGYYFQTSLEIDFGVDAKDRDYVTVLPNGLQKNFFEGFSRLGFTHFGEGYTGQRRDTQIVQFRPTSWLAGEYDEIVFMYQPGNTQSHVSGNFELDKRNRGLGGFLADQLDLDERKGYFSFTSSQLATPETAEQTIRNFIIEKSKGLISG